MNEEDEMVQVFGRGGREGTGFFMEYMPEELQEFGEGARGVGG